MARLLLPLFIFLTAVGGALVSFGCSSEQDADLADSEQAKAEIVTLAAGRLTDDDGMLVSTRHSVHLEKENPNYLRLWDTRWSSERYFPRENSDKGEFLFEGVATEGEFQISVGIPEYAPIQFPIALGADDIEIRLQKACRARGKFLLDPGISGLDLQIYFLQPGQTWQDLSDNSGANGEIEKDGSFLATGLPSGPATLVLCQVFQTRALFTMPVDLGRPGTEIKIDEIDLRGKLKEIVLSLQVEGSLPAMSVGAKTLDGEPVAWAANAPLQIITDKESLDLEIWANGYGNLILMDVREDMEFAMPAGTQIEVLLSNAPPLPEGCYWICTVVPVVDGVRLADKHGAFIILENGSNASTGLPESGQYQMVFSLADWRDGFNAWTAQPFQIGNDERQPIWDVKDQERKQVFRHTLTRQEIKQAKDFVKANEVTEE
jgi:hypothetical protein